MAAPTLPAAGEAPVGAVDSQDVKARRARTGWTMGLFATFCFSIAPPLARLGIDLGLNPTEILFIRMWMTGLLLAGTIAVTDIRNLWPERRCILIAMAAGLTNSVGMMGYFWALTRIDVSVASMIFSVSPLFVLIVLALRGEPVTRRHVMRFALALAGIWLLIGPGGSVDLLGLFLLSLSIASFSVQILSIQFYLRGYDARSVTLYTTLGMALGITLFWFIQSAPREAPSAAGWTAILLLVVVGTYLARLSFFGAITRIGGAQMALLTPLEIMLTVFWSVLFLGERLLPLQWAGGLLVVASAVLAFERVGRAAPIPHPQQQDL